MHNYLTVHIGFSNIEFLLSAFQPVLSRWPLAFVDAQLFPHYMVLVSVTQTALIHEDSLAGTLLALCCYC